MNLELHLISSMATREILGELAARFTAQSHCAVRLESAGGVDVMKRVQAGEVFDLVVLAKNPIDQLITEGKLLAHGRIDLAASGIGVAVQSGAARPPLADSRGVIEALRNASTIGYSTGPSGTYLLQMFRKLGVYEQIESRLVQAPPGVPVASLVAQGKVAIGFQQISEIIGAQGAQLAGPLPEALQFTTIFSAAATSSARQPAATAELLAYLASPAAASIKRQFGMEPVTPVNHEK